MSKTKKENWKAIKSYDEYIMMLKSACEELDRSITPSELEKHKFDLPSAIWLVNNSNKKIETYDDLLESLGYKPTKKHNKHKKYTYEIAYAEFAKRGFILLLQEYKSSQLPLKFICPKHPNIIQEKSLNNLIFNRCSSGNGCNICRIESLYGVGSYLWKGGIAPLNIYLRDYIVEWKKNSMASCNYKCAITGEKFDDIHHLYSYNKILKEIIDECNLPIYTEISEYTKEELDLLKLKNIEIHGRHPLGVCLCKEVHKIYHNLYGDDNTPEQFEEFKVRYNNGEFDTKLNKKQIKNNKVKTIKKKTNKVGVKIDPSKYSEIREKYKTGNYSYKQLAEEYPAGKTTISKIINFKENYSI